MDYGDDDEKSSNDLLSLKPGDSGYGTQEARNAREQAKREKRAARERADADPADDRRPRQPRDERETRRGSELATGFTFGTAASQERVVSFGIPAQAGQLAQSIRPLQLASSQLSQIGGQHSEENRPKKLFGSYLGSSQDQSVDASHSTGGLRQGQTRAVVAGASIAHLTSASRAEPRGDAGSAADGEAERIADAQARAARMADRQKKILERDGRIASKESGTYAGSDHMPSGQIGSASPVPIASEEKARRPHSTAHVPEVSVSGPPAAAGRKHTGPGPTAPHGAGDVVAALETEWRGALADVWHSCTSFLASIEKLDYRESCADTLDPFRDALYAKCRHSTRLACMVVGSELITKTPDKSIATYIQACERIDDASATFARNFIYTFFPFAVQRTADDEKKAVSAARGLMNQWWKDVIGTNYPAPIKAASAPPNPSATKPPGPPSSDDRTLPAAVAGVATAVTSPSGPSLSTTPAASPVSDPAAASPTVVAAASVGGAAQAPAGPQTGPNKLTPATPS